ncbi:unnamed protein product [Prunus armeniaca]|uniref:CAAX prenyl protease 2/Lysostaphin resistance protein A-like domain-containing protein n=1 Tax=Prunus armeniaca TaxID=36596 RepID=A0A6J5WFN2_PRUAR|nr:unnamed protein product [Prunus armeniaca]
MSQRNHGSTCLCATHDKRQRYCFLIKLYLQFCILLPALSNRCLKTFIAMDPFSLQKGWLLWAEIGLAGAIVAIAVTGATASLFKGESLEREEDALVSLFPLIASSSVSTACLLGVTGVLAPILEETVFQGFFYVLHDSVGTYSSCYWNKCSCICTCTSHSGRVSQLFVLGSAVGLSYAQTRNILTPITIHALWNSRVILLLTFLHINMMMFEY